MIPASIRSGECLIFGLIYFKFDKHDMCGWNCYKICLGLTWVTSFITISVFYMPNKLMFPCLQVCVSCVMLSEERYLSEVSKSWKKSWHWYFLENLHILAVYSKWAYLCCRMTLLLGPPGCGKTTLLKALSGNLNKSLKVSTLFLWFVLLLVETWKNNYLSEFRCANLYSSQRRQNS